MNFEDSTLVRLADPAARLGLLDTASLEQLVAAAYDTDAMPVEGPYQAVFDQLRLGMAIPRAGTLEGFWSPVGGAERTEARFRISGLGEGSTVRVDAFWKGSIIARAVPATSPITEVRTGWPDGAGIDAEIAAALGSLPADPVALEQERRARLLARVRGGVADPAAFTEASLDRWLAEAGVDTVGELLARGPLDARLGTVRVRFGPAPAGPATPVTLPIAAALLIRDTGFSLAQLLMESKLVREELEDLGLERPVDAGLRPRRRVLVAWLVPQTLFDDADWPGGTGTTPEALRAGRRQAAGRWLAQEGIGLVVVPPP